MFLSYFLMRSNMYFVRFAWRLRSHAKVLPKLASPPVSVSQSFATLLRLRIALRIRATPG